MAYQETETVYPFRIVPSTLSIPCVHTLCIPELIRHTHGTLTVAIKLPYPAILLSGASDVCRFMIIVRNLRAT